ncbi:hypothetical protein AOL_s00193g188 [Orbilia oligospora ATCC 24927]|uniref:Uncharacterized protein n=1 Tax=Arthrobotrys oligospora (strain ATCC 24927 / CBS 115.81 / DSM 1491) TaxID=756982 RepID=G1XRI9_ARTOA|nr:hypothetical protein AOL_s00193g188 [Orbilia oligospora ATCC 24927]EGX44276.1 hypothetical protein AOL_s00193g188 [Orbilia oligospora ATCC 24927]
MSTDDSLPLNSSKKAYSKSHARSLSLDLDLKMKNTLVSAPPSLKRFVKAVYSWPVFIAALSVTFVFLLGYHLGNSAAEYRPGIGPDISLQTSLAPIKDRPLITYVYFETENARKNALFFIRHGLHFEADFIFIINGESDIVDQIPVLSNIKIIRRKNTCFDLGAHAEVLTDNNNALINSYRRFILLNASIRGPFMPTWSRECWSDAYLAKVTEKNKLVGMTMNCNIDKGRMKVLNSMIYATDRIGLNLILPVISHCFKNFGSAVQAENRAAREVLNQGYDVEALMTAASSLPDYARQCTHGTVLRPNSYFGINLHPYETIFQKANRDIAPKMLDLMTKWHDQSNYSSWEVCSKAKKGIW